VSVCICLFINAGCVRPCVYISTLIPGSECVRKHTDLQGVSQCSDLDEIAAVAGRSLTTSSTPRTTSVTSRRTSSVLINSQRREYPLPKETCPKNLNANAQRVSASELSTSRSCCRDRGFDSLSNRAHTLGTTPWCQSVVPSCSQAPPPCTPGDVLKIVCGLLFAGFTLMSRRRAETPGCSLHADASETRAARRALAA